MILKNNRLTVEIDETNKLYEGVRFDNLGTISRVTLDEKYEFMTSEFTDERFPFGGIGLSNEFKPIITDGEYMKIGIGVIKVDGPYDFMYKYDCDYAKMSTRVIDDTSVEFTAIHHDSNYDFTYTKTVSINENKLRYDYKIVNTGEKEISTLEYCHNFINMDNNIVGKGYYFTAPCDLANCTDVAAIDPVNNTVSWDSYSGETFFLMTEDPKEKISPACWELKHTKNNLSMTEKVDLELERFLLWGQRHVVSAEMLVRVTVLPAETTTWNREFEWNKLD